MKPSLTMNPFSKESRMGLGRLAKVTGLDFFPLRHTLLNYSGGKCRADALASVNVALLTFPQAMAYAVIAGLPIQYGVFCASVASILGALLIGNPFVMFGATNATSVLLFAAFLNLGLQGQQAIEALPTLLLLIGLFLMAGALLRVAGIVQFISRAVATGYITAAAIYIVVNQIQKMLHFEVEMQQGSTFFDVLVGTLVQLPQTHLPSLILTVLTIGVYVLVVKQFPKLPGVAVTLVVATGMAMGVDWAFAHWLPQHSYGAVERLSAISASSWPVAWPNLSMGAISQLAPTAAVIAFLGLLESSSIGRQLASRSGKRINTNQVVFGMGFANLGCGFLGGMPVSGSLTRSQLNFDSGARTAMAGMFCGLICLGGVFLIGPLVAYIPVAALGVVVVAIGLSLINKHVIKVLLRSSKGDAAVFAVTFIAALLVRLDFAIVIGAIVSIGVFLRKAAAPEFIELRLSGMGTLMDDEDVDDDIDEIRSIQNEKGMAPSKKENRGPAVSIVHVGGDLFFGASDALSEQVRRVCGNANLKVLLLKLRGAYHLDATCVLVLEELVNSMQSTGKHLVLCEVRPDVRRVLNSSGLTEKLGEANVHDDDAENPTLSAAQALKQAKKVMDAMSEKDAQNQQKAFGG